MAGAPLIAQGVFIAMTFPAVHPGYKRDESDEGNPDYLTSNCELTSWIIGVFDCSTSRIRPLLLIRR